MRPIQSKKPRGTPTPRLLSGARWLVVVAVGLLPLGLFLLGNRSAADKGVEPTPWPTIPREPPVELLSVPNSGFSCAVEAVLKAKCRRCHTRPPRHGAPFPLLTWEDTRGMRPRGVIFDLMEQAIKIGSMPFRTPANPPVEPLTPDEKQILLSWLGRGAPRESCP